MKKLLAITVAVAMLVSLSVIAAASVASEDTDVGIEFRVWSGQDDPPTMGIHNPGEVGEQGNDDNDNENDNWPLWVAHMQNWNLHFGERDLPNVVDGTTVTFRSYGDTPEALDFDGSPVNSLVGVVVQSLLDDGTPISGNFELRVGLSEFEVEIGGTDVVTLQGFDLTLEAEAGTIHATESPTGTPRIFGGALGDVTQREPLLVQDGAQVLAAEFPAAIVGFQWSGELEGQYNEMIGNFSPGEAQAEMTWTLVAAL